LNVLLLSNYGTWVGSAQRQRLPRVGYQEHLLANVKAVLGTDPSAVLRWRPHPGDDLRHVALSLARFGPRLSLSSGGTLEDDLDWADLIISSLSSTVVEALAWDKPLLLHAAPIHEADVLMRLFSATRRFRTDAELASAVRSARADLTGTGPAAPERALREEFFGPSGEPGKISDVVFTT
jgi:hypothetical protein